MEEKVEIVISILQEDYEAIKDGSIVGDMTIPYVFEAIRNGISLPKGHGRLIDTDKFINDFACFGYIEAMNVDYFRAVVPIIIEADKDKEVNADADSN